MGYSTGVRYHPEEPPFTPEDEEPNDPSVAADLPFRHEVSYGVLVYRAGIEVQRRSRQFDEEMQRELRRPINSPRRSLSKRRF